MSIGYVTKPFPSKEYIFLARDGAIGPVDQCSAPTEEDFRSSETSNGISQIPFEPDRALFAQKRGIHRMPLFAQNKSARRDSNPRPRPWQGRAPPTEPLAHYLVTSSVTRIIIYDCFSFVNYYFANFSNCIYYCKNSDYFALTAVVSSPACYSPVH